jgi:predicted nuclease of predicted toxin-antitoxin system
VKFLIDECLSPALADLARQHGFIESTHVSQRKRAATSDRQLTRCILAGDWTFVTRHARDFRGSPARPGNKGPYRIAELHAGLVCINGPTGMDLDMQIEAFIAILDVLEAAADGPDLTNQVLEATVENEAAPDIILRRYHLPAGEDAGD